MAFRDSEDRPLITIAMPGVGMGGADRTTMLLAREFGDRGFRVDIVLAWTEEWGSELYPEAARVIIFGVPRLRYFVRPFTRYLKREKPDAVLAVMWPVTSLCLLAHRLARCSARIVIADHSTLSMQYAERGVIHRMALRGSMALTYPLADARIVVSEGVADDVSALSGIARHRFSVIHNPLSLPVDAEVDDAAAEAAWRGCSGRRIITVGRFRAAKNHALLIRAFRRLLSVADAHLMILGAGELANQTASVAKLEGVADRVLMPGEVYDPTPFYRSADLFVLSSDYEGFGNVLIEALACGLPVVSTDCRSGPAEILQNGRYGRLVPVGDAVALGQAMAEALSADHDHDALKRRAADFSPMMATEKYLHLLLPRQSGPRAPPGAS